MSFQGQKKCPDLPYSWQFTPSSTWPSLQVQLYEPTVFLQLALLWQLWSPVPHSSISEEKWEKLSLTSDGWLTWDGAWSPVPRFLLKKMSGRGDRWKGFEKTLFVLKLLFVPSAHFPLDCRREAPMRATTWVLSRLTLALIKWKDKSDIKNGTTELFSCSQIGSWINGMLLP